MKKAKLLGYYVINMNHGENSEGHEEGYEEYVFVVDIDGNKYQFSMTYSFGSCGSGYCSASWATSELELKEYTADHKLHEPVKDVYINVVGMQVQKSVSETEYSWDAILESVNTTDGELVVRNSGDGGCQYYSSGVVKVNTELFKSNWS